MAAPAIMIQPLSGAMAMADRALADEFAWSLAVADDPLRIDLPPVLAPKDISAETLRAFGAMYLQAELEQAGIAYAADLLSDARHNLSLRSTPLAQMLEDYFRRRREWLNRDERLRLFGRLFGIGTGTGPSAGSEVNHDFQRLFAGFNSTLLHVAEPWSGGTPAGAPSPAALRQAGANLLSNLIPRQYGNAIPAGRQIQAQLRAAIAILSHEGVTTYLGVRTMWDVLRSLFSNQSPDLGRLVTRGQSGMRLLHWMAESLAWFTNMPSAPAPALTPAAALAAQWLEASGFQRRAA